VCKPASRISFSEKQKIVDAMCLHFVILESLAELEQLRRGLAVQKFNSLMEAFPHVVRKAFTPPEQKISSDMLQDLFVPAFSPKGSNRREVEEAVVMCWLQYLQHVEGEVQTVAYMFTILY